MTPGAPPTSIEAAAEWFRKHFRPEMTRDLRALIAFELTGPQGGALWARIEGERLTVTLGRAEVADVRLTVSARDWTDVLGGRANAEMLAMAGRIQIHGDLSLAMRLRSLFRRTA